MDALDRKIIIQLERDPRTTYKAMSKQLGISVPTAQRRVENLFATGRLRSIRYRFAVEALGGKWALIHGHAKAKLTPELIEGLREHGSINRFSQCVNNYIICWCDIKEERDIEGVTAFLESRLALVDHQVLILSSGGLIGLIEDRNAATHNGAPINLDALKSKDLQIIRLLGMDGRRTISSIAEETGISYRGVKKRIDMLVKNRIIVPEIDYYLGVSDDVWFGMYVRLSDPSTKDELFNQMAKFGERIFTGSMQYLNAPDVVTFDGTVKSLRELHDLITFVNKIQGVVETNHTVIQMSWIFDTWVHRISRGELPLPRPSPPSETIQQKMIQE